MIQFWVGGKPKAQPRPRMTRKGHVYNPSSANEWKARVMWRAREAGIKNHLFENGAKVTLSFVLKVATCSGVDGYAHIGKPDIDNLAKSCLDALTKAGAWLDDSQVFDLRAIKRHGELEGVLITIEEAE